MERTNSSLKEVPCFQGNGLGIVGASGSGEKLSPNTSMIPDDLLSLIFKLLDQISPCLLLRMSLVCSMWKKKSNDILSKKIRELFSSSHKVHAGCLYGLSNSSIAIEKRGTVAFLPILQKQNEQSKLKSITFAEYSEMAPNPNYLEAHLSCDSVGKELVWTDNEGKIIKSKSAHQSEGTAIFSSASDKVADDVIISNGCVYALFKGDKSLEKYDQSLKKLNFITDVKDKYPLMTAEGHILAIKDGDHVHVWDTDSNEILWKKEVKNVSNLCLKEGKCLIATSSSIDLHDMKTGKLLRSIKLSTNIRSVDMAGEFIVTSAWRSKDINIWYWPSQELIHTQKIEEGYPNTVKIVANPVNMQYQLALEVRRDDGTDRFVKIYGLQRTA